MQLQSKHDSATSFVDAGNAYKKADPQGEPCSVPCPPDLMQVVLLERDARASGRWRFGDF